MENPKEEDAKILDRASRATRGKRMTKLLDEEIEVDELFWNQDALKEEESDMNYEEEAEVVDEFDSDFDDEEPVPDDEENNVEEVVKVKKRLIFPGKAPRKKSKKKAVKALESVSKDGDSTRQPQSALSQRLEDQEVPEDLENEKTVRKSTRTSVIVRQAERDAIKAALQATMKPTIKRKKEGEEKRMTQEEMLLEAAQTEIMNLRNLECVLAREEEVKKRAVVDKEVYDGPIIRYFSRHGKSHIEFMNGWSFQSEICTSKVAYADRALCAVTSLPAKYRDPLTGLPYATKEAFKIIRQRFVQAERDRANQEVDKGMLLELVSGDGFPLRRKRSRSHNSLRSIPQGKFFPHFQN